MKEKGYDVRGLYIVTTKETRNINTLHDESAAKIVKFIKRVVQKGQLNSLDCVFGDQEEYIFLKLVG